MKLLEGKVALVTGATRGIGKGIALKLAEHGADVAFTFVSSPEKAKEVEQEVAAFGVKAMAFQSNAADYAAAEKLIADVNENFGRIDIVEEIYERCFYLPRMAVRDSSTYDYV